MIDWPELLPNRPEKEQYNETFMDTRLRSSTDMGPGKVRQRFTAGLEYVPITLYFTATQLGLFDTFWQTTTKRGSLKFGFMHPRRQVIVPCLFKDPPTIGPLWGPDLIKVSFILEVWPS